MSKRADESLSQLEGEWEKYKNNPDQAAEKLHIYLKKFDLFVQSISNAKNRSDRKYTDALSEIYQKLSFLRRSDVKEELGWTEEYRSAWREHSNLFVFCLCVFIASIITGHLIIQADPSMVSVFIGDARVEDIILGRSWFKTLGASPLMGGINLAMNNMRVAFNAFVWSGFFGLGGIYVLTMNGILLGAIFSYCKIYGFHESLGGFILAHGPLELTIIIVSCFAGFLLAQGLFAYIRSGDQQLAKSLARKSLVIAFASIPFLMIAAFLEAFVSPYDYIPLPLKVLLGFLAAAFFRWWTLRSPSRRS